MVFYFYTIFSVVGVDSQGQNDNKLDFDKVSFTTWNLLLFVNNVAEKQ